MRHLLRILKPLARQGYQYPLDVYLFEDFVSRSSARPKEMKYLYEMLQTQGDFFKDTDGWPNCQLSADPKVYSRFKIALRLGSRKWFAYRGIHGNVR